MDIPIHDDHGRLYLNSLGQDFVMTSKMPVAPGLLRYFFWTDHALPGTPRGWYANGVTTHGQDGYVILPPSRLPDLKSEWIEIGENSVLYTPYKLLQAFAEKKQEWKTALANVEGPMDSRFSKSISMSVQGWTPPDLMTQYKRAMSTNAGNADSVVPGDEEGMVVHSLQGLRERETEELHWVIPQLLPEGLTILAGPPKVGKSWLALRASLHVACGTSLFDQPALPAGPVLYLALEDSPTRFRDRVDRVLGKEQAPELFQYGLKSGTTLLTRGLLKFRGYMRDHPGTRLIVIDTLGAARGSQGSYQSEYELMHELQQFAHEYHVAVLLVHHTRKQKSEDTFDQVLGSQGLTGAADTTLVLTRRRTSHETLLHVTGRDVEEQDLVLRFLPETCTWESLGNAHERVMSQERMEVLELLGDGRKMTPIEIARELGKKGETMRMQLSRMREAGLIVRTMKGEYRLPGSEKESA
jgi:DNA-binding transcriptional ArsR family regulator